MSNITLVWVCVVCAHTALSVMVHPGDRDDTMGQYVVGNQRRCQRLCLYRALCQSYSYNTVAGNSGDINCVLHAGIGQGPLQGWEEKPADTTGLSNGCASSPCGQTEVCVPVPSSYDQHKCLPWPANCGRPEPAANATVQVVGTLQGDVATVTCDPYFVMAPRGVSPDMTCQVTSRWTAFNGACIQAEYDNETAQPYTMVLPWGVYDGWEMCLTGVFKATGRLVVVFLLEGDDEVSFTDISNIPVRIIMREDYDGVQNETRWDRKVNGAWQPHEVLTYMPLRAWDNFRLSLRVINGVLDVTLHDYVSFQIPSDLSGVGAFHIRWGVELHYLNLISSEACFAAANG